MIMTQKTKNPKNSGKQTTGEEKPSQTKQQKNVVALERASGADGNRLENILGTLECNPLNLFENAGEDEFSTLNGHEGFEIVVDALKTNGVREYINAETKRNLGKVRESFETSERLQDLHTQLSIHKSDYEVLEQGGETEDSKEIRGNAEAKREMIKQTNEGIRVIEEGVTSDIEGKERVKEEISAVELELNRLERTDKTKEAEKEKLIEKRTKLQARKAELEAEGLELEDSLQKAKENAVLAEEWFNDVPAEEYSEEKKNQTRDYEKLMEFNKRVRELAKEKQLTEKEAEVEEAEQKLRSKAREVGGLEGQVLEINTKIRLLTEEGREIEDRKSELSSRLTELENKYLTLSSRIDEDGKILEEAKGRRNEQEGTVESLMTELENLQNTVAEKMQKTVDAINSEAKVLRETAERAKRALEERLLGSMAEVIKETLGLNDEDN